MADAENLLKKIRKLEANRICPNCNTPSPTGLGFGNICMKFRTFVCDNCKTSHQAISHRCKSVSMSSWTMEEVQSLTTQKGGGNEVAIRSWLAHAPPCGSTYRGGSRPKQGDRIEIFKQFVVDCYESRMFYGESNVQVETSLSSPVESTRMMSPTTPSSRASPATLLSVPPTPTISNAPTANLLDDPFNSSPNIASPAPNTFNSFSNFGTAASGDFSNTNFDDFNFSNSSQPSTSANSFAAFDVPQPPQRSVTAPAELGFNSFGSAPAIPPKTQSPSVPFDPFAGNDLLSMTSSTSSPKSIGNMNNSGHSQQFAPSPLGTSLNNNTLSGMNNGPMNNNNNSAMRAPAGGMGMGGMGGGSSAISGMNMLAAVGPGPSMGGMPHNGAPSMMSGGMQYGQRGPPPSSNQSFDFIGSAIKSEIPVNRMQQGGPMSAPIGMGMPQQQPMGMGMGMGGMNQPMNNNGMNGFARPMGNSGMNNNGMNSFSSW